MKDTQNQFKKVVEQCSEIFTKKMMDYGVAWRIMRTTSVTDQIFIKLPSLSCQSSGKSRKPRHGTLGHRDA